MIYYLIDFTILAFSADLGDGLEAVRIYEGEVKGGKRAQIKRKTSTLQPFE